LPLVVEIFPRVLTGPVRKNSPSQRERYLGTVPMRPDLGRLAAASEDAFDAAISAVVMTARVDQLQALPDAPGYALEGKIWQPRDPFPLGTAGHLPAGAYGDLATTVAAVIREAQRVASRRQHRQSRSWTCSASIWSAPDGSSRIVWMINRMIKQSSHLRLPRV
jgi:hypothetical protein